MSLKAIGLKVACVVLVQQAAGAWAQAAEHDASADLYQQALLWMADGQYEEARAALQGLVAVSPQHAGAWLDIAILQCAMGDASAAEALFTRIERDFEPPQAILDVIAQQRLHGCRAGAAPWAAQLRFGRGFDNNVNQGASQPGFTVGSGLTALDLVLTPEYLPRGDTFSTLAVDGWWPRAGGDVLFGQLQVRRHDDLGAFDVGTALLGAQRPWVWGPWRLQGTASLGWTTFGGALYQQQAQALVQALVPLAGAPGWRWGGQASVAAVRYARLSGFDALVSDARLLAVWNKPGQWLQASAGYAQDAGNAARAGGQRTGTSVSVQGRTLVWEQVAAEWQWSRVNWQGQQVYAPGLIDVARSQQTQLWRAALTVPLAAHQALQLELRNVRNAENVPIFSYAARSVQLSWLWQLGP